MSSHSTATSWHFDGFLQGDLLAGTPERMPSLVRSCKQNKTGTGQHVDRKLDFAGDDAGNSIDGSLTSESVLSWQTSAIPRAVCCWKCCISYRRCKRRAPVWESPAVLFGRSGATVHFSLGNGILPLSKAYSYETTACSFNAISHSRDCSGYWFFFLNIFVRPVSYCTRLCIIHCIQCQMGTWSSARRMELDEL